MTAATASAHPSDAKRASTRFAHETLEGLAQLEIKAIVIGGWAVRLYGSPVFSIDLDILIPPLEQGEYEKYDFIQARTDVHKAAFADSYLEVNELDDPNKLWISGSAYVPGDLIDRFGRQRISAEIDGFAFEADVPSPPVLEFMKVKAMLNRANKLDALRRPERMVMLDDASRELIEGIPKPFLIRKVAKDMVDVSYLLENHAKPSELLQVLEYSGLRTALGGLTKFLVEDLFDAAHDMTTEHGLAVDSQATLGPLLAVLADSEAA